MDSCWVRNAGGSWMATTAFVQMSGSYRLYSISGTSTVTFEFFDGGLQELGIVDGTRLVLQVV